MRRRRGRGGPRSLVGRLVGLGCAVVLLAVVIGFSALTSGLAMLTGSSGGARSDQPAASQPAEPDGDSRKGNKGRGGGRR